MADEMLRTEFLEYMKGFEARLNQRFDSIYGRVESVEGQFGSLKGSMEIQFEETHRLIRLSLEAVEGLRETTERGFSAVRAELGENTSLLKDVVRHVRGRVERVERRRK